LAVFLAANLSSFSYSRFLDYCDFSQRYASANFLIILTKFSQKSTISAFFFSFCSFLRLIKGTLILLYIYGPRETSAATNYSRAIAIRGCISFTILNPLSY
jgi:hypothetical protein